MKCKDCLHEIEETETRGALGGRARAHVEMCVACRAAYDERRALAQLFGELETVRAPADFDFRLAARLAVARSAPPRRRIAWNFAPGTVGMVLATSFVIVVIAAISIKTRIPLRAETTPAQTSSNESAGALARVPATASESAPGATVNPPAAASQNPEAMADSPRAHNAGEDAPLSRRMRASDSRQVAREREPEVREANSGQREDYSVQPAPLITEPLRAASQVFNVPVRASTRPLRINVRDERGTTRAVSLESVSFGAQDMSGALRPHRASLSPGQGVW